MALLLILGALLWQFVYTPVALIVAAVSRSFFKTLNPVLGVDTIIRMGSVYWQALLIYAGISIAAFISGVVVGHSLALAQQTQSIRGVGLGGRLPKVASTVDSAHDDAPCLRDLDALLRG